MAEDWLERFADVLGETPMSEDEIETILDLTRVVAHTTVRRYAPLSSYLLGLAAADAPDREQAAVDLAGRLRGILPADEDDGAGE